MVTLSSVVVHHIENDFNAVAVQHANHGLELLHCTQHVIGSTESKVRSEERESVVSPVVLQTLIQQVLFVNMMMNRLQLNSSDAKFLQVLNHRLGTQTSIGSANVLGYVGVQVGKTLDMGLIDNSLVPWDVGMSIIAPSEGGINDSAKRTMGSIVGSVDLEVLVEAVAIDVIREETVVPCEISANGFGIGIEEHLVAVESQTILGVPVSFNTESV